MTHEPQGDAEEAGEAERREPRVLGLQRAAQSFGAYVDAEHGLHVRSTLAGSRGARKARREVPAVPLRRTSLRHAALRSSCAGADSLPSREGPRADGGSSPPRRPPGRRRGGRVRRVENDDGASQLQPSALLLGRRPQRQPHAYGRAAARLQSALSLQIRKLEQQLGHDLFERKGKQLVLTEAGQIALDHADVTFGAGEELLSTLREEALSRDVLRIGALSTLSRNFRLAFLAPAFGRPEFDLIVRSGTLQALLDDLERHEIDVALTNIAPPRDRANPWIIHRLAEQQVALVGHPARLVARQSLAEALATHPIVVPMVEAPIRAGFDALLDRLSITPHIAAEVDDMALLRLLARENRGLALVPPLVVRDELDSGRLVEAFQLPDLNESFFAITRSRRFPNRVLKELVAVARQGLSGVNYSGRSTTTGMAGR